MVQVTPFRGTQTIANSVKERRNFLQDVALAKGEQGIRRTQADTAASKERRLGQAEVSQVASLLPAAIQEAAETAAKLPPGKRVAAFNTMLNPIIERVSTVGIDTTALQQEFGSLTEADFEADALAELPASLQEFNAKTQDLPPADRDKALRVDLGLEPRAVTSAPKVTLIGGVPHIFDATTKTMKPVEVEGQTITPEVVAQNAGTVAAGTKAGEAAIKQSQEAIKQLGSIKKSISNIEDAIVAIDEGANTGAIASRLPSITQASIELDNVRARMGLDVIGATTFGALSKGELDLALGTALPTGLSPPQLRDWLVRKKDAQNKLAAELEGAAIFLGQPGNTPAKYLELLRSNGGLSDDAPLTAEEQAELEALEAELGNQ